MVEIRPARADDGPRLTGLLAQLGYPSELDVVTSRLALVLNSAAHGVLVAAGSRIDGCITVERRLALLEDERVEITGLVVDSASRRVGLGRALVRAAEQWAVRHGVHTMVVRSNVVRPEAHPFYEDIGFRRKATSHVYGKEV
ncbi:GNAT family N-acetyltransferase [Amycolatopsis albispora]|uniref:GNAT family N-acetyltransferase n=1 Tax=Amycolatopsis albispora TaxID=1804986 RepID=A0A344L9M1_9PSEU|nr:GNAT family N-acetyltransferase [Amycolatopsis albispora]AXB44745.1 GNAT family N-acetyltransferase [Amycolatopsis albispora]